MLKHRPGWLVLLSLHFHLQSTCPCLGRGRLHRAPSTEGAESTCPTAYYVHVGSVCLPLCPDCSLSPGGCVCPSAGRWLTGLLLWPWPNLPANMKQMAHSWHFLAVSLGSSQCDLSLPLHCTFSPVERWKKTSAVDRRLTDIFVINQKAHCRHPGPSKNRILEE